MDFLEWFCLNHSNPAPALTRSPVETLTMFIQTEATPNPATLKFLPGRTVLEEGTLHMPNADAARQSP
ncbi:NifU N-terminal domain-containing protein, partial [Klebsiella pneumoniae]|uniref:NifU N-terminal domain-containing protein n=1 Tax=Klebsiella pneumoniae TaxID=573 RepID=UPI0019547CA8